MPYKLKNQNLEITIDNPLENYNYSRFDWTGKISEVKYHGIKLSSIERTDIENENILGKGFYNEFGIDTALGFEEAEIDGWFHKIGIGLLKKDSQNYNFLKKYEVKPADFKVIQKNNKLTTICKSEDINEYSYILEKEIEINKDGFSVNYNLNNTGQKEIKTDEYAHNFMVINKECICPDYILKFPFELQPSLFLETVNPEQKIEIGKDEIKFNDKIIKEFFFSNLSGNNKIESKWELVNLKSKISISETLSVKTDKINLWGWKHVISPELYHKIHLKPNESAKWSRVYKISKIK